MRQNGLADLDNRDESVIGLIDLMVLDVNCPSLTCFYTRLE
jgi:hypothetical protein